MGLFLKGVVFNGLMGFGMIDIFVFNKLVSIG